jgi:hypothetical protein
MVADCVLSLLSQFVLSADFSPDFFHRFFWIFHQIFSADFLPDFFFIQIFHQIFLSLSLSHALSLTHTRTYSLSLTPGVRLARPRARRDERSFHHCDDDDGPRRVGARALLGRLGSHLAADVAGATLHGPVRVDFICPDFVSFMSISCVVS